MSMIVLTLREYTFYMRIAGFGIRKCKCALRESALRGIRDQDQSSKGQAGAGMYRHVLLSTQDSGIIHGMVNRQMKE